MCAVFCVFPLAAENHSPLARERVRLEKFRLGRAQRTGHDPFRRRLGGIHGAQPTAEQAPGLGGVMQGQALKRR